MAALTFLYQLADFLLSPPAYMASVIVEFTDSKNGKMERDFIYSRPNFLLSTSVLYPACDAVDLAEKWSRYMVNGDLPRKHEVYQLLLRRILIKYSKSENGSVEITIFSEKPEEAIEIANAIAASLQNRLNQFCGIENSNQDTWIQKAENTQRVRPWLIKLVKTLIIVFPCSVSSIVLLWVARLMPPPIPMPSKSNVKIFSNY
jgi:hypothetical protein